MYSNTLTQHSQILQLRREYSNPHTIYLNHLSKAKGNIFTDTSKCPGYREILIAFKDPEKLTRCGCFFKRIVYNGRQILPKVGHCLKLQSSFPVPLCTHHQSPYTPSPVFPLPPVSFMKVVSGQTRVRQSKTHPSTPLC